MSDELTQRARDAIAAWYQTSNHDPLESGNLDALHKCVADFARAELQRERDELAELFDIHYRSAITYGETEEAEALLFAHDTIRARSTTK